MPTAFHRVVSAIAADLQKLSSDEVEILVTLLRQGRQTQLPYPAYLVNVNYGLSVEAIAEKDTFDWVSLDVNSSNFPSFEWGEVKVLIYLIDFPRHISSEDVVSEMEHLGLRPATLKELLVLAASQPDLQRNNSIVALGSRWEGFVPFLNGGRTLRSVDLCEWKGDWNDDWRFAAVRK